MDESIIQIASQGDVKAFKQIFDFYLPRMRPVALRYAHTDFEADDILQESFIKIYRSLKNFRHEGSFEGWVKRIVVNTALSHHKKNQQFYAVHDLNEITEFENDIQEITEIEEANTFEILKIIEKLPQGYKVVFNLFVFDDLSHKEIATILGIEEGTSRSQYAKAKKMIKNLLSRQRNELPCGLMIKNR